jgi:hypothetical protein
MTRTFESNFDRENAFKALFSDRRDLSLLERESYRSSLGISATSLGLIFLVMLGLRSSNDMLWYGRNVRLLSIYVFGRMFCFPSLYLKK